MVYSDKLKDKINSLPDLPGVYIFKNKKGQILYIGKAKSLKKRVQSYFSRDLSSKTQAMLPKIADIEYRPTPSESQAQLLESSLIKEKQPVYNVSLKDDKSFPLIRITHEDFPMVSIYRRKKLNPLRNSKLSRQRKISNGVKTKDKSLYFGPYTNAALLRQALKVIRKVFGFRSCKTLPKKACLYGRIKLCPAPCTGNISVRRYKEIIKDITLFLDSKYEELLSRLCSKMKKLAEKKKFEDAAKIRDQINALGVMAQGRTSFSSANELQDLKNLLKLTKLPERIEAFDISNIYGKEACGSMVSFLKGLLDKNNYRRFRIKTVETIDDYRMLAEVVRRRYSGSLKKELALPDLILIDGGRSHLSVANKELQNLGLKIPLVSIAKDRENIYTRGKRYPLKLDSDTPALNLIRRIRDEAHRFARAYHHILRRKKTLGI